MKVWEMIMLPRERNTEIEVRDNNNWSVLYDTMQERPLEQAVGELDIRKIESLGQCCPDDKTLWITVYAW
jgi:hypothetical protein